MSRWKISRVVGFVLMLQVLLYAADHHHHHHPIVVHAFHGISTARTTRTIARPIATSFPTTIQDWKSNSKNNNRNNAQPKVSATQLCALPNNPTILMNHMAVVVAATEEPLTLTPSSWSSVAWQPLKWLVQAGNNNNNINNINPLTSTDPTTTAAAGSWWGQSEGLADTFLYWFGIGILAYLAFLVGTTLTMIGVVIYVFNNLETMAQDLHPQLLKPYLSELDTEQGETLNDRKDLKLLLLVDYMLHFGMTQLVDSGDLQEQQEYIQQAQEIKSDLRRGILDMFSSSPSSILDVPSSELDDVDPKDLENIQKLLETIQKQENQYQQQQRQQGEKETTNEETSVVVTKDEEGNQTDS